MAANKVALDRSFSASIGPKKVPATDRIQKLTASAYKPVDVWVDGDHLVRQVKVDFTTKAYTNQAMRAHVLLTMKLSDFGETVEFDGVDGGGKVALMGGHGWPRFNGDSQIGQARGSFNASRATDRQP